MAGQVSAPGHGGGKRGRLEVNADPNVIPFIDVMLVLLIIFMIAAPISTVDIQVQMPPSQIGPSHRPPRPTWISVKTDNVGTVSYYVMNDPVPFEQLGEKTRTEWEKNTPGVSLIDDCLANAAYQFMYNCRIYIRADGDMPYRNVVRVMNALQSQGFIHVAFVAEDRR